MGRVVLVAVTYFAVGLAALHVLGTGRDPIAHTTSHYAVGPYSFLMATVFLSMSIATFALIAGLYRGAAPGAVSRAGLGLLGLWGAAVLVAMAFPINPDGTPATTSGTIHWIAGPIGFLSLSLGAFLVSRRLRTDPNWTAVARPAQWIVFLMLAGFAATLVSVATQSGFAGLSQRILLGAAIAWYVVAATRLRSLTPKS